MQAVCYQTTRSLLSEHVFVGGGLLAMNDDAMFLTYRGDCIAGKPPPTIPYLLQDSAVSGTQGIFHSPCFAVRPGC